ncbi:hypothetical protein STEG23_025315 [Scotinomys teguina]
MDINTVHVYCRDMDPDMALDSSPGTEITMAPGDLEGPKLTATFSLTDSTGLKLTDILGPKLTVTFSLTDISRQNLTDFSGPKLTSATNGWPILLSKQLGLESAFHICASSLPVLTSCRFYLADLSIGENGVLKSPTTRQKEASLTMTEKGINLGCGGEWYVTHYTLLSNQPHLPFFTAMSRWSGSRPLAHHHHWTLTKTPLGYPAVAPSHGVLVVVIP